VRKRTFHAGVFSAVTTLYLLSVANLCLQWYILSNGRLIEIIITVGTPDHDAWAGFDTTDVVQQFGRGSAIPFSPWAHIVNIFLVYTEFIIADGLLVSFYYLGDPALFKVLIINKLLVGFFRFGAVGKFEDLNYERSFLYALYLLLS